MGYSQVLWQYQQRHSKLMPNSLIYTPQDSMAELFYNQPYLALIIIYHRHQVKAEVGRSWPGSWAINPPYAAHVSGMFHAGQRRPPPRSLSAQQVECLHQARWLSFQESRSRPYLPHISVEQSPKTDSGDNKTHQYLGAQSHSLNLGWVFCPSTSQHVWTEQHKET